MVRLIFILLIGFSLYGNAQTAKYKDVVPMIEGTSDEYAIEVLHAYLVNNMDHPAANLRIASYYLKKVERESKGSKNK